MSLRPTALAELPPAGITGLDPTWSRLVYVPAADHVGRTWHLLDSWAGIERGTPRCTLLCVHGNPSWSFLWRKIVASAPADVRVIAVDQLDMGFSERTGRKRNLATRVDDLVELTKELGVSGPVVTVAHDWGGPISLGWALRHHHPIEEPSAERAYLAGIVLTNTAVHQPPGSPAPSVIRLIRSRAMLRQTTVNSLTFIRGAFEMSRPRLAPEVRSGFKAPYLDPSRREAIADFVKDIPLDPDHESAATLDAIADGLEALSDTPALLLWGPKDLVFGDLYLHDLEARLPHADVHRFPGAAHFVPEEADVAGAVTTWLTTLPHAPLPTSTPTPAIPIGGSHPRKHGAGTRGSGRALSDFSNVDPATTAVIEMAGADRSSITFGDLTAVVERTAAGMAAHGIAAGDRVALMIPPGIDLSIAIYACWRRGATVVLVDSGLGAKGMQRALVGAAPQHLIGIDRALVAAQTLRWPGRRISVEPLGRMQQRALSCVGDLRSLGRNPLGTEPLPWPDLDDAAAVIFTSGATGPSKGVRYRHRQLMAQRDALVALYQITPADRLVAAFAPFALYGPTMGITSVVPDMDVTAPSTLTARALGDAISSIDATLVFASPAALVNAVATAADLGPHPAFDSVRLLLSAGAPVRSTLLADAAVMFPNATAHTPYGMTEALPVADISLAEILEAERTGGDGVCVGHPLPLVDVSIDPLDALGRPTASGDAVAGVVGEIVVRAPHTREGYDRLWVTQHGASPPGGWHRTGDVGHIDEAGRLWVGGRLGHVISTPTGPLTPVKVERDIETLDEIRAAAVVGVGPPGSQAVVAVVESAGDGRSEGPAPLELIDDVRAAATVEIAAVLLCGRLPVDRRHNSKIDRSAVADWAGRTLSGQRSRSL